jgi:hypothetical protein
MYYVIENFPYPSLVVDEEGLPMAFSVKDDAKKEASDCQDGVVIEL